MLLRHRLKLQIYDIHSGLREIRWQIRDADEPNVIYGGGHAPVHLQVSGDVSGKNVIYTKEAALNEIMNFWKGITSGLKVLIRSIQHTSNIMVLT